MKRNIPGFIPVAAGAALMGIGIALGQPGLVMTKAVRVCLECVGIG